MNKYIIIGVVAVIAGLGIWWAAKRIAQERCDAEIASVTAVEVVRQTEEIQETKRKLNAETLNSGSANIRAWLRDNFTIAD